VGPDAPAERAVAHLAKMAEPVSVRTLAGRMGTGVRRLQRSFARSVGVSPRTLQRLLRFQRFYSRLDTTAQGRWTELAIGCGYYDQAHLIRDFREFTGSAPSMFLSQETLLSDCFLGRRRESL
jgi:transcriptional regulator GlxA family with amidase domain